MVDSLVEQDRILPELVCIYEGRRNPQDWVGVPEPTAGAPAPRASPAIAGIQSFPLAPGQRPEEGAGRGSREIGRQNIPAQAIH